jgi:arylsulfatase A-like enzyme
VQHGVHSGILATRKMQEFDENVTLNRIASSIQTIPEVLREAGYATFGISDNLNVSADLGFDQGFDRFVMTNYAGADSVNALLNAWHGEIRASEPYFVYVHNMDPHIPYHARDEWYEKPASPKDIPAARYDSEIGYVDSRIRTAFERFGWKADAIVCVTSDHGEEFYDHGATEHGKTLYQEVIHVPLLWRTPGGRSGRVAAPVSLVDVLPTIRALAGLPAHSGDVGVSLTAALDLGAISDRTLFGHVRRQVYRGGQTKKSAIAFPWKMVWTLDADRELYDLVSDPAEKTNRIADQPKIAARLEKAIVDFEAGAPTFAAESTHTSLDTETLEKLRALGYVR